MIVVVATTEADEGCCRSRLGELGVDEVGEHTTRPGHRLLLADVADEGSAERLAARLRAEGIVAVARPDRGGRRAAWERDTRPVIIGDRVGITMAWSEHERPDVPVTVELGHG